MPKVISLIFICLLISFNCSNYIDFNNVFKSFNGTIQIHTTIFKNVPHSEVIENGKGYIISSSIKNIDVLLNSFDESDIKGYTFFLKTNDIQSVTKKLGLQYSISNQNEIVAYSNIVPMSIYINNIVYNTQIIQKDEEVIIGFPVILGSY